MAEGRKLSKMSDEEDIWPVGLTFERELQRAIIAAARKDKTRVVSYIKKIVAERLKADGYLK